MQRFSVTKEIEFDYGHRIQRHDSKCKNLHGHRGKIEVTVSGPLQEQGSSTGMVLDFGDLKKVLMELHDKWDHGMLLEFSDPFNSFIAKQDEATREQLGCGKIFELANAPTAENLAFYAFGYVKSWFDRHYTGLIKVESLTFWETPTSRAKVCR